jgi:hypothetical protein
MLIYYFVADTTILARNGFDAFEGFFDVSYRKHDYDYCHSVAQENLMRHKAQGRIFADLDRTPKPIDQIDPDPNNLDMAKVDEGKRKQVTDQILSVAHSFFQELGLTSPNEKSSNSRS